MEDKQVIFIVDDQPAILHTAASILRDLYRVKPFTSGKTLLERLEAEIPDIILLDYEMPEMNGSDTFKILQSNEKNKSIPVVFLTGTVEPDTEAELLEKGAADYIYKPIKPQILLARVRMQLELAAYRRNMEILVSEKTAELKKANEKLLMREDITLNLLARATDMRDHDTGSHLERTTEMVRIIVADLLQNPNPDYILNEYEAENIIKSAKLHDIGKIGIPDGILLKPGRLTHDEFEIIKNHPIYGTKLLEEYIMQMQGDSFLDTARDIALCHHEKWDGSGYPYGLSGIQIPLAARITAIADVYDALMSKRPYKEPFSQEKAVQIIKEESGIHFDTYIAELFLKHESEFMNIVMKTNGESYAEVKR